MARPEKLEIEEVLNRASDLFWKRGCDAVSTRDLEAALGIRAPAIYRRFKNKHVLLARSIDHYVDKVVSGRIERVLNDSTEPIEGLHQFFHEMLKPHCREEELRGCLLTNTLAHEETDADEVRTAVRRGFNIIRKAFCEQIKRAINNGSLGKDTDADALSQALFISLQGLLTLTRAKADVSDLKTGVDVSFKLLTDFTPPETPAKG